MPDAAQDHIMNILNSYAGFSAIDLEIMTHKEDPWITARKGYTQFQRCEVEIDENQMKDYYKARLSA